MAKEKTSVVSAEKTSVASRAKTSVAAAEKTPDISISSTTPRGRRRRPRGVVDFIEMSGVFSAAATDVLALDTTNVFSADTTDVLYAAKADDGPRETEGRAKDGEGRLSEGRCPGRLPALGIDPQEAEGKRT